MKIPTSTLISFILLLCLLLICASATSSQNPKPKCHPKDQKAMEQIAASFGINFTGDCCEAAFVSVQCTFIPPYNRVTYFKVINSNIYGKISDSIGDLSYLGYLEISNAPNLSGNIPPAISKLSKLTSISITNTRISGPIPDFNTILTNFTFFDLSHNALTGSIPYEIPRWFPNLTSLALGYNKLTGTIPESLGHLSINFDTLDLSQNFLTGPIPKSLGNLNLENINLSGNRFSGDASFLFNENSTTEALSLFINDNDFSFDFSKVKISFKMRQLNLSHNNIFGSLPKDLTQAIFLLDFDVSHNMLCGKIPVGGQLQHFKISSYAYNKCLCGAPLPACK